MRAHLFLILENIQYCYFIYSDAGMDTSVDVSEGKLVNDATLTPTQSAAHFIGENDWSYEFHENHGRNIQLESKTSARRVASYNQGIIYSHIYTHLLTLTFLTSYVVFKEW